MSGRMEGMVAIVTGATRGLGAGIAEKFAREGATVYAAARKGSDPDVNEHGSSRAEHRDRIRFVRTDVTDETSVEALFGRVAEEAGGLDVLVNNAGVSTDGLIARTDLQDWRATVETNLTGTFLCTREAATRMRRQGGGRIINVSSSTATRPVPGAAAYCSTKAAIEAFTRCTALEVASWGIAVNCLAPGYIDAGLTTAFKQRHPETWARYRSAILAGRPGLSRELAAAALYLASADSSYVNGHVLEVNGGLAWNPQPIALPEMSMRAPEETA